VSGGKKYTCPFSATWLKDPKDGKYKFTKHHFGHNHVLCKKVPCERITLNGKAMKKRVDELTNEERNMIRDYCNVADMYHLKLLLRNTFKNTDYSRELLHNVVNRERRKKKSIKSPLRDLFDLGKRLQIEGGIFDIGSDDEARIDRIIFQSRMQRSFVEMYGDFFVVDGTHGTNIHGMTLMLPCVVDALGKTKIVGSIICHTESHEDILFGLKTLGLAEKKATMMTDQAIAFGTVAKELGLQHVLCTYHFGLNLFTSTTGMNPVLRTRYLDEYNHLLHGSMAKADFEEKFGELKRLRISIALLAQEASSSHTSGNTEWTQQETMEEVKSLLLLST